MNSRPRSQNYERKVLLFGFVVAVAAAGMIVPSPIEERDLVKGYGLDANSCVRKPVDFERFTASVNQIELYWLVLDDRPAVGSEGGK